jgi:uracil-DNA glycosylase
VKKKKRKTPKASLNKSGASRAPILPLAGTLDAVREAAKTCRACDLWKTATQTVFGEGAGEGAAGSSIMLVGEQPGDQEDRQGHPFVGPAGKILDEALAEAGIDRAEVYVTNVVKHFKWSADARGKRRIHKKPRSVEINACRPWLDAELDLVKPRVLLCLGATAAQAIFGKAFSVTRQHGQLVDSPLAPFAMATMHPSSVLRAPDSQSRHEQMRILINDLRKVALLSKKNRAA